jgi:hypothetical protein
MRSPARAASAIDTNADVLAELMRARAKWAGTRLLGETQRLPNVARTSTMGDRLAEGPGVSLSAING